METDHTTASCGDKCPCMVICPLVSALGLIGGKWKIPILCSLYQDGPARYNTLKKKIGKITNTMLAVSLKELEQDGLITRTQFPEMPVRVEYSITGACQGLIPVLASLAKWSVGLTDPGGSARDTL